MNLIITLQKVLSLVTLTTFLAVPAYSQIIVVSPKCVGTHNENLILSVAFNKSERKMIFQTSDLNTENSEVTAVSSEITSKLQYEDVQNPLQIVSQQDAAVSFVMFTSKGSILISNAAAETIVYRCHYFPQDLGLFE